MVYLLDANALIALTIEEHEHHRRVAKWAATAERVALCPVVEGALIRFLVRLGESVVGAMAVLRQLHENPRCEFWNESLSYLDADLAHVRGHRQVTDAYLVALAGTHEGGRLATLDHGLVREMPDVTLLIPSAHR